MGSSQFVQSTVFYNTSSGVIVSLHNLGSSKSKIASMLTTNREITNPIPFERWSGQDCNESTDTRDGYL